MGNKALYLVKKLNLKIHNQYDIFLLCDILKYRYRNDLGGWFLMKKEKQAISLDEALRLLEKIEHKLGKESLTLFDAMGRVLAEDIFAIESLPPFDRSAFDGYALSSKNTKGLNGENFKEFSILEEVPAGSVPTFEVTESSCTKILTGAPIPKGADCIIPFEKVEIGENTIKVFEEVRENQFVSFAGSDIKKGQLLAKKGEVLSPNLLSVLASGGIYEVNVFKKIKIGAIATGSEVLPPGAPYEDGKIRNSSQFFIVGLKKLGFDVKYYGICDDDLKIIKDKISLALSENDVVITTGGVSVGTYDLVQEVAESLDGKILAEKLNFRPGTAFLFSEINGKFLVGLSGNVGSAFTDLWLFCVPLLKRLSGQSEFMPKKAKLKLAESILNKGRSARFEKCKVFVSDGEIFAKPISKKDTVKEKDCNFLVFVPSKSELKKGELGEGYFII